jgi:hypothetical protein
MARVYHNRAFQQDAMTPLDKVAFVISLEGL